MPEPIVATEVPPAEAEAAAEGIEAPAAGGEAKEDPWAGLPEEYSWAKSEVDTTRREAANYRTQLREAQDKLKNAKTPEEVAEITKGIEERAAKAERESLIERLARTHSLSDDNLEFLTATTPEELTRQAEKLSKLTAAVPATPAVVVTKVPLSGGVTPGDEASVTDGRAQWRQYKQNR